MLPPLVELGLLLFIAAGVPGQNPAPPQPAAAPRATVLVVAGVPGTGDYATAIATAVRQWREAAGRADAEFLVVGDPAELVTSGAPSDHDRLRDLLARHAVASAGHSVGPLWLVLLGHGSFDGREAKFNLRGPDLADAELAEWLKPIAAPVAVLDCSSASAPFLSKLAGPDRIVVSATKSGAEQNYARFGQYLAETWADPKTDLDKDGQASLLEGFLVAARRTADFYKEKARLSTEHALIDDNADGRGTPADWFEGVRLARKPKDGAADGRRAHQLHLIRADRDRHASPEQLRRRDELELKASALQDTKAGLDETEYYRQLEAIMVDLARTYDETNPPPEPDAAKKP